MARKLTYDIVKQYVDERDCKLLTTNNEFDELREEFKTLDKFNLKILCKCGNEFECTFIRFKHGKKRTCNKCSFEARTEQNRNTIEEVRDIIKNDGSGCELLEQKYLSTKVKMLFKCSCGETFKTSWENYYYRKVRCCEKCRVNARINKTNIAWDYDMVLKYVNKHGEGCKLLSKQYKSCNELLDFKCKCGEIFTISFGNFCRANQHQCSKCGHKRGTDKQRYTIEEIKQYLKDNGFNCTLVSKNYINAKTPIEFKCSCGGTFKRMWDGMRRYKLDTCLECTCSKGEKRILEFLKLHNIKQEQEFTYNDLVSDFNVLLRFDFAILDNDDKVKFLIEYDGEYHFEPICGEGNLQRQQYHDRLKDKYSLTHNISLIRIPYWEYDNLEKILIDVLVNNNINNEFIIKQ